MHLTYTLDGDQLVLDIREPGRIDRRAAFERLKQLGAPLTVVKDVVSTKARMPREGLPKLRSALTMVGGKLVPARGQPPLDNVNRVTKRYEDVRPFDVDEVLATAKKDEDPAAVLRPAMDQLRSFALANPGLKHRAEGDLRTLRKAMDTFAPQPSMERKQEPDPVKQAVSRSLQGVPEQVVWKARNFLLELHDVAGEDERPVPSADVPDPLPGFHGKLRDYQRDGVSFLLGTQLNCVLADDMGLGKTIMTIAAVLAADERALVVCPANVLHNWAAEVERFTGEPVALWHGRSLEGEDSARFRITTYDSLRLYDWRHTDAGSRGVLVLDEAHYVRNPDTQRAVLVKDLPQQRRVLLTGTPVVNGLEDYNELLLHVGEQRWADRESFRQVWTKDRALLQSHPRIRQAASDLLQRATRHVVLRRRKDDVLDDLPPRTITVGRHVLEGDVRAGYEALEQAAREALASAESEVKVFAHLHKLRQYLLEHRVDLLEERLRELVDAGEAVVVYSQYLHPLRELKARLGDVAAKLDGSTPPRERERLSRALGEPDGPRVLLAQVEAGGIGLNLTGARHVIFAHLNWTAAVHRQAIDRVHRIGQDKPVFVELYVSPDTIDERMADIVLQKEADANLALSDTGDVLNRSELARALLGSSTPNNAK